MSPATLPVLEPTPPVTWPATLTLSAAPLSTWRAGAGTSLENLQPFLRPSAHLATTHPCRSSSPCACEHEIRSTPDGDLFAVCICGECVDPFPVTPADLTLFQLDLPRFARALAAALSLEPVGPRALLRSAYQIGYHGPARTPAVLFLPGPPALGDSVAPLILHFGQPFLLLVPTADALTPSAREHLAKAQSAVLDLQSQLVLAGPGQLRATGPVLDLLAAISRSTVTLEVSEAARIFQLMKLLESEPQQRKAPLLVVFRLLVLEGLTHSQAARRCKCAKSLLTVRVKALENRFGLSIPQLRAHAHALVDLGNEEKHNQRLRRRGSDASQPETDDDDPA